MMLFNHFYLFRACQSTNTSSESTSDNSLLKNLKVTAEFSKDQSYVPLYDKSLQFAFEKYNELITKYKHIEKNSNSILFKDEFKSVYDGFTYYANICVQALETNKILDKMFFFWCIIESLKILLLLAKMTEISKEENFNINYKS